jgi:hypothetical protein
MCHFLILLVIGFLQLLRKETSDEIREALKQSSESDGEAGEEGDVEDSSSSSSSEDNEGEDSSSEQHTSSPKVVIDE